MSNKVVKEGYRPDIDGIRAIAVLAVIFYHFNFPWFSGGFVGVDMFFVISGYLITKGIVTAADKNKFSFANFYLRRTRRLIPALLAIIGVTFIFALFLMSPKDFAPFSGSVLYALVGISNLFFWMQSGYFDNFSSLKPLLHTWSLSVELQFYLFWPVYLLFICKFFKSLYQRLLFVLLFTACFTVLSVWFLGKDSSGAFYLTPFRMHEFAIGALIVFLDGCFNNKKTNFILYFVGLVLVLGPIFVFDVKKILFPGYYALIPCVGTSLLILSGKMTNLSALLSGKIPAFIGEISYSLYLVHWPLYVLTAYALVLPPSPFQTLLMLIATLFVSLALYYYVERKFRNPTNSKLSGPAFSLVCTLIILIIAVPSASSWANNGWEWRLPEAIRNATSISKADTVDYTWQEQTKLIQRKSFDITNTKPKLLIIGDSQSADIINIMKESGQLDKYDAVARTIYYDCGGTNYVSAKEQDLFFTKLNPLTIARPELIPKCKLQFNAAMNEQLLLSADKIYIAMYYQQSLTDFIIKGFNKITQITSADVYVFGRKNLTKSSVEIISNFNRLTGIEAYATKFENAESIRVNKTLQQDKNIKFINLMDYVCPEKNKCLVVTKDNKPLFYDPAHFTRFGAKYFGDKLSDQL